MLKVLKKLPLPSVKAMEAVVLHGTRGGISNRRSWLDETSDYMLLYMEVTFTNKEEKASVAAIV